MYTPNPVGANWEGELYETLVEDPWKTAPLALPLAAFGGAALLGVEFSGAAADVILADSAAGRTFQLLDNIMKGYAGAAGATMVDMGTTPEGQAELANIAQYTARLMPWASSPQMANALKSILDVANTLSRAPMPPP
jgi:hypothetical protein